MADNGEVQSPGFATPLAGQALPETNVHWVKTIKTNDLGAISGSIAQQAGTSIVVLDFFGLMCGECIDAIPLLSDLQDKYLFKDVSIVGVHILEKRKTLADVEKFAERQGDDLRYGLVKDLDKSAEAIWSDAGLEATPGIVIVKNNIILWAGYEVAELDAVLQDLTK